MSSKLKDFFTIKKKHLIHKWNIIDIYEESFNKFIGKNPVILEIGIFKGGLLIYGTILIISVQYMP